MALSHIADNQHAGAYGGQDTIVVYMYELQGGTLQNLDSGLVWTGLNNGFDIQTMQNFNGQVSR